MLDGPALKYSYLYWTSIYVFMYAAVPVTHYNLYVDSFGLVWGIILSQLTMKEQLKKKSQVSTKVNVVVLPQHQINL